MECPGRFTIHRDDCLLTLIAMRTFAGDIHVLLLSCKRRFQEKCKTIAGSAGGVRAGCQQACVHVISHVPNPFSLSRDGDNYSPRSACQTASRLHKLNKSRRPPPRCIAHHGQRLHLNCAPHRDCVLRAAAICSPRCSKCGKMRTRVGLINCSTAYTHTYIC